MSLGSGFSQTVNDAVKRAVADGIVMVVAAGNNNANAANYSPASTLEAITVGATTSTDARASFSNFGSVLDIFAPGNLITSAWYTSSTATSTISGTSMASPHVAGVAALYLEAKPGSTPAQVSQGLKDYATRGVVTSAGTGSPNLLLYLGDFNAPLPLAAPVLSSPANGSTGISTSPTLNWSASSGATGYRVQVSTSSTFGTLTVPEVTTSAITATVSGLAAGTTYFWRVAAVNGTETVWSASRSFTTALAVPTLASPANTETNVSRTPTFTWNTTGAASYDIQVATRSNFTSSSIVVNRTAVAGTSFTQTTALRSRTTHYWRVRSRAANGTTSAWSASRSFTTL
jgi:subtilisin family serine protease